MDNRDGSASRLTRRRLLQTAGGAAAAAGLVSLPGCGGDDGAEQLAVAAERVDAPQFPPLPPSQLPAHCNVLSFFTPEEGKAVEAFTARLVPGTPDDPGAREACVTRYIDQKLGRFDTFATPTYFKPPFAKPAEGHAIGVDGDTVYVPEELLPLYGFQSSLSPQDAYRNGIEQLDRLASTVFGKRFVELSESRQDDVITGLEANDPSQEGRKKLAKAPASVKRMAAAAKNAFRDPSPFGFFSMLQDDTSEGMFADPVYGGNRNYVGWALIGYPGAQRAYTPRELKRGPERRTIQGLRELHAMHPGRVQRNVILPIEGTRRHNHG
jgi:gluconate 2-dehydrogenase gamma chain